MELGNRYRRWNSLLVRNLVRGNKLEIGKK